MNLEIDDASFRGGLWTFKQWLPLNIGVRYGISIVLLLTFSCKAFSSYEKKIFYLQTLKNPNVYWKI